MKKNTEVEGENYYAQEVVDSARSGYTEMTRLVHLHRKYCSGADGAQNTKSIEDLQKDFYACSDDFRKLEVYL